MSDGRSPVAAATGAQDLRSRVRAMAEPIARSIGRSGLTPNHLTLIGFAIAIVAAIAAAGQSWVAAGLLVVFGGLFDLLDGALARATGRVSAFGAFMDSVFDRWGEGVIYVGVAWGSIAGAFNEGAVLATAALAAAVMVSYARAKSEGLGFTEGRGMASVGLAPREIRIVILAIGLILVGVLGGVWNGSCPVIPADSMADCWTLEGRFGGLALTVTLGLIAILSTITVVQRILHVRKQAAEDRA